MTSLSHIDGLIAPKSVAIIGASDDPTSDDEDVHVVVLDTLM